MKKSFKTIWIFSPLLFFFVVVIFLKSFPCICKKQVCLKQTTVTKCLPSYPQLIKLSHHFRDVYFIKCTWIKSTFWIRKKPPVLLQSIPLCICYYFHISFMQADALTYRKYLQIKYNVFTTSFKFCVHYYTSVHIFTLVQLILRRLLSIYTPTIAVFIYIYVVLCPNGSILCYTPVMYICQYKKSATVQFSHNMQFWV